LPSAGQIILFSSIVKTRLGILKKEIINKNNPNVTMNKIMASHGSEALKNVKDNKFKMPKINAVMAMVLYPSLCIYMLGC
jgi:3-hydroxyacyl-CoA dehydrogenase